VHKGRRQRSRRDELIGDLVTRQAFSRALLADVFDMPRSRLDDIVRRVSVPDE
jgi:hypothetical protein